MKLEPTGKMRSTLIIANLFFFFKNIFRSYSSNRIHQKVTNLLNIYFKLLIDEILRGK